MQIEMITYTPSQRKERLTHLESVIKRGLRAYEQVGAALAEIKKKEHFFPDYATFEAYCEARNISPRHANRIIRAAQTTATLKRHGIEIGNEAQAREMARLLDEYELETAVRVSVRVWQEVGEARGGKHTADALREAIDRELGIERKNMDVHYSSDSEEWYTPDEIVERVKRALGGTIDLDPCADAQENILAKAHYTKDADGLKQEWNGKVFLNPPYGQQIGKWIQKLVEEHRSGRTTAAVALVPSRTDTQWYAMLDDYPRCHIRGRLTFKGAEHPAPFPSVVFYLGPDEDAFMQAFGDLGKVWRDAGEEGTVPLPENLSPEEARRVLEVYAEEQGGKHGAYVSPDVMRRATHNRARRLHNEDRPPTPQPTPEELKRIGEKGVEIFNRDFRELVGKEIEDGTVDLVLTDPPYDKGSLHLYSELGEFAKRVLKPDGVLVCYTGTDHMLESTMRVHAHVPWWWQLVVTHQQADTSFSKNFQRNYKPIEVFGERPSERLSGRQHRSVIEGSGGDKEHHPWGQPIEEALHLIDSFTDIGDLVVDPFCGGGTVPAAAVRRARRCIAAELDEEYYRRAVKRVEEEKRPQVAFAPPRPDFVPPPRPPNPENQERFAEHVREALEEFDINVIVLRPYQLSGNGAHKTVRDMGAGERGWIDSSQVLLADDGHYYVEASTRVFDDEERNAARMGIEESLDLPDTPVEGTREGTLVVDAGGVSRAMFTIAALEGLDVEELDVVPVALRYP